MSTHYPFSFHVENGTNVTVDRTAENRYHFLIKNPDGTSENFEYSDDGRTKEELEAGLTFNQLNALRVFWLKREEVI